jgi:thiol-disulfide isomerase/thioredoxin
MKFLPLSFLFIILTCVAYKNGNATPTDSIYHLEIGKPFPNLTINDIEYFKKRQISISESKGKWLILDFWGEYCGSCLASFPKVNNLQKNFQRDVQFLMIGVIRKDKRTIESLYGKMRNKYELKLPVSFDNKLHFSLGVNGLPFIIVIDPEGIVRAITSELTPKMLNDFVNNRQTIFRKHSSVLLKKWEAYNYQAPLLLDEENYSHFMYRAVISKWDENIPQSALIYHDGRFEALGFGLEELYKLAYFGKDFWFFSDTSLYGKSWPIPLLEMSDTSLFQFYGAEGLNLFCYSLVSKNLIVSSAGIADDTIIQRRLQNDLQNVFGLKANIEEREMPCYLLLADQKANDLKTLNGKPLSESLPGQAQGKHIQNLPITSIISVIYQSLGFKREIPIIDKTEITNNIDITLESIFFDDLIKELKEKGIEIKLTKCTQKVLVIRN